MNMVLAGTKNEIQKILSKKRYITLFVITLLITLTTSVINILSSNNWGFYILKSSSLPITILQVSTFVIIPLFIFMVTSDLFSGELSDKSMILTLVRPIERYKVYISKILSVAAFIAMVLGITFIASFIASFIGGSISNIFNELPKNILVYTTSMVPMIMVIIFTAFVAQFFRNNGSTVVIMVLSFAFLYLLGLLSQFVSTISPLSYTNWYNNFAKGSFDVRTTINELMFILAYVIIFLSSGIYLFMKKDV